uniref:Thromboxane-A synthase n=1 Tax=Neolamprologus brichardi TaxID=32507 RepID=A0A3Q4HDE2_NEOBR
MQAVGDFLNAFNMEVSRISVTLSLFLIFLGLLYWFLFVLAGISLILYTSAYFRYYLGRRPVVIIADPDMLRQLMVKDFSSFPNRMAFRFATKPMTDCLLMLRNEQWKRVRSILTPSFSSAKLKEMVPLINIAIDALMKNLNGHAESAQAFDIHKCFGYFTMDVIASVAFATQVDSQNNPDDPFVHHAQMFFNFSFFRPILLFFMAFPFLAAPMAKLIPNERRDKMNNFFINSIQKIIKQREEQPPEERRRDFLQLMLDARTTKEIVSLDHFDTSNDPEEIEHRNQETQPSGSVQENDPPHSQEPSVRRPQKKMMTEDEIVGQAFVFLLAGYETSSNTLAFTCYLLALHPECQLKVQKEVDDFYTRHSPVKDFFDFKNKKVDHDCVVNGQFLPKGITVEIPAGFLHYDPEHWPEPEEFIPERFTPEAKASRHPFVYLPFGAGPRNCVGMRLAQLEIKMALVRLFQSFSIVACSETKVPLELKSSSTLGPKNGIYVKITRRDQRDGPFISPSDD